MPARLLRYRFATDPAPCTASAPTAPLRGRINPGVLVTAPPVYCDMIILIVPVGPTATDAFAQKPVSSINTDRWVAESVRMVGGADARLDSTKAYAQYTFVPRDRTDDNITYPLAFGLLGQVSDIPGTFPYAIRERSGTT